MSDAGVLGYGLSRLSGVIRGKKVLEVGSRDGRLRRLLMPFKPSAYIGIDLIPGFGVDLVADACRLSESFLPESVDVVVSTETLEHILDWQSAVSEMKRVLKPGGHILVTVPSEGFPLHNYPADYWRYSRGDIRHAFFDFETIDLRPSPLHPGLFYFGRKPEPDDPSTGPTPAPTTHDDSGRIRKTLRYLVRSPIYLVRTLRFKDAIRVWLADTPANIWVIIGEIVGNLRRSKRSATRVQP